MSIETVRGHLDLLLLAALKRGEGHGYALIERLRNQTHGRFEFPEGSIYPTLHRLEAERLVKGRWADQEGRRRKLYILTPRGQRRLESQRHDWRDFAAAMHAVLEGV